jgi:hypothetical protein
MTKEQAYDDQISPHMAEIIRICGEHKIAFVASFALGPNPEAEDEELLCTSMELSKDRSPPVGFLDARRAILDGPRLTAITITKVSEPQTAFNPHTGAYNR